MNLIIWQAIYLLAAITLLPFAPFLYLQGQLTRKRVGILPGAGGDITGVAGSSALSPVRLLVIGESTVEGLGARDHERALAGQFAAELSRTIGRAVEWTAIGKSGVTARQAARELIPKVPSVRYDFILVGLGGNDVMKLSSPRKWRRDMTRFLSLLRERSPDAVIFLANCPAIRLSPALPQPIKFLLWELSKLHDANIREFTAPMHRTFYYHQPHDVPEGFFADGIHPSEKGYAQWSKAMMVFFNENYRWQR